MLIEFRVANFKSIKEEQSFSLVASKSEELVDSHTFDARLPNETSLKLLRSAAIYGPNAAGKTNLLYALRIMQEVVVNSASKFKPEEDIPVIPFKLHPESRQAPSEFEVVFVIEDVRHQYGFSAIENRVIHEWLLVYPKNRGQCWFERSWNKEEKKYDWDFGAFLKGEKKLWQKSTRDNALFLSTAVHLNSLRLKPIYDWFATTLQFRSSFTTFDFLESPSSLSLLYEDNENKKEILRLLKEADLGIDDLHIEKELFDPQKLPQTISDDLKQELVKKMENKEMLTKINTVHQGAELGIHEESDGTQKIFWLAGPFIEGLRKGHVIFIDELHSSLHPALVRYLVGLFNSKNNTNNAQLIFTTHETNMLDQKILRRDQIWFCEKDETQATRIYPLTDFRPRKGRENLEIAYLSGRYGALPYIPEMQT